MEILTGQILKTGDQLFPGGYSSENIILLWLENLREWVGFVSDNLGAVSLFEGPHCLLSELNSHLLQPI